MDLQRLRKYLETATYLAVNEMSHVLMQQSARTTVVILPDDEVRIRLHRTSIQGRKLESVIKLTVPNAFNTIMPLALPFDNGAYNPTN